MILRTYLANRWLANWAVFILQEIAVCVWLSDSIFGLIVRVPGCYLRDPGFDSRRYQIF
jgi:hypothetical protein